MQELRIGPNEAGQRLDKYLHKALPAAPNSLLYQQLRKKNLTLNKKKAEGKEILKEGDVIQCFFSQETFEKFLGRSALSDRIQAYRNAYQKLRGIEILYEDENFLFLNKPVGVLSQKAAAQDLSINEWLIGYLLGNGKIKEPELETFSPSVCNRLDRNTSGIVLCGKSLIGLQALSALLKERGMEKYYHCICKGRIREEKTIEGFLIKDEKENRVMILKEAAAGASPILTRYVPLEASQNHTLLEVELITGKTHQIRAHLSSMGHPILGDSKYGGAVSEREKHLGIQAKSQLLHAHHVCFPSKEEVENQWPEFADAFMPLSGKTITATEPKEFQKIRDALFSKRVIIDERHNNLRKS